MGLGLWLFNNWVPIVQKQTQLWNCNFIMSSSLALCFQPLSHIPFVSFAILFDKRYNIAFGNCTVIRVSMIHKKVPSHWITFVLARLHRQLPRVFSEFRFFQRQKIINKHCMSLGTKSRTFNQTKIIRLEFYRFYWSIVSFGRCTHDCSCFQIFFINMISKSDPKSEIK